MRKANSRLKNCVLCGQSPENWNIIAPIVHKDWPDPFYLYKCKCGLVFTSLAVDESDLSILYQNEYFRQTRFLEEAYKAISREDEKLLNGIRSGEGAYLLDVGCGEGYFLDIAKKFGYKTVGIDISETAINKCREKGHEVFCGDIDSVDFGERQFDLVVTLETLEHVKNPVAFLKGLRRYLKPKGVLLVKTIHLNNIIHQGLFTLNRATVGYINLCRLFIVPHHTYYFDTDTLNLLVTKSGFTVKIRKHSQVPVEAISSNPLLKIAIRFCYGIDAVLGQGYIVNLYLEKTM